MRLQISVVLLLFAAVKAEQSSTSQVHRNLSRSSSGSGSKRSETKRSERSRGTSKSRETVDSDDGGVTFDVDEGGGESVQVVCSAESVKTQSGYENCLEMCDMARCCFRKKDLLDSCIENEVCNDYIHYCHILKTVEDPQKSGRSKGSSSSDGSNESEIEKLFEKLKGEDDKKLKVAAADDLWMHCKTEELATRKGYKKCKKLCKPGKCCHSKKGNCWEGNDHICATYRACESLEEKKNSFKLEDDSIKIEKIVDKSKSVQEACHVDNVLGSGVGREECYTLCEEAGALCCSKKGKHNCSEEKPDVCTDYADCDILVDSDPEIIDVVCTADLIKKKGNGWRICKEACSLAECCHAPFFDSTGESSNCYQTETEFCEEYQWCEELEDEDIDTKDLYAEDIAPEEITHTPSIAEMCALENVLTVNGYMACNGVCSDYECCFDDETCSSGINCEGMEECELFFYVGAEMVLNACTEANIQETEGRELCEAICDAHECCREGNCNFLHDSCNHYQSCEILNPNTIENKAIDDGNDKSTKGSADISKSKSSKGNSDETEES